MRPMPELPRWTFPGWPRAAAGEREAAVEAFVARDGALTKPAGSLGVLEALGRRLAHVQRDPRPQVRPAACLVFASDHPVAALGVSAYPIGVTRAMVANFVRGGAAASVLCKRAGLPLYVIDVGVAGPPVFADDRGGCYTRAGVADAAVGDLVTADAMPPSTYRAALSAGAAAVAARLAAGPLRALVIGEMGIGNTTCAAAVTAALTGAAGADLDAVVGRGTGIDDATWARKRDVVASAVGRVRGILAADPDAAGHRALAALGGRELAAMVGAMAHAIERDVIVLVDGYIASAAALALCTIAPAAAAGLVFGHQSREPGHQRLLAALRALPGDAVHARPLLDLDLALGEASGALLAFDLLDAACCLHDQMATFAEAAVPDREGR